jgi:hypothetical protein
MIRRKTSPKGLKQAAPKPTTTKSKKSLHKLNKPAKKRKRKPITIAARKAKARRLQNWTAENIALLLDLTWGHEDEHLVKPRPMGQKGSDVILIGEAMERFPFHVECKSQENMSWAAAIRQAKKGIGKKNMPYLIVLKKKEFKTPHIIINGELFFVLMRIIIEYNPQALSQLMAEIKNALKQYKQERQNEKV